MKTPKFTKRQTKQAAWRAISAPRVQFDMGTFGEVRDGVCFTCFAGNTLCELMDKMYTAEVIEWTKHRANFFGVDQDWLDDAEQAFNYLRLGNVKWYNFYAQDCGLPHFEPTELPKLTNESINDPDVIAAWQAWCEE